MRIFKSIVGRLSVLCLVLAVVTAVLWVIAVELPVIRGGNVYRLPAPRMMEIANRVADDGLTKSDSGLLRDFVTAWAEPEYIHNDANFPFQRLIQKVAKVPSAEGVHSASAALVMDKNGLVIASYPQGLVGRRFPLSDELKRMTSGSNKEISVDYSAYWQSSFMPVIREYVPNAGSTSIRKISKGGETLGYLLVSDNGDRAVPSPEYHYLLPPKWLAVLAGTDGLDPGSGPLRVLVLLGLHILLLWAWVGLDAGWRGMRPFAWTALVMLTGVIGLAAYLLARGPDPGECKNCGEKVYSRYARCPSCGSMVRSVCPVCGKNMRPGWQFCPACNGVAPPVPAMGASLSPAEPVKSNLVEEPTVPDNLGALAVQVSDQTTGMPVGGVSVTLSGPASREGTTSGGGIFEARKLKPGEYKVSIVGSGYDPVEALGRICEGACSPLKIALSPRSGRVAGRIIEKETQAGIAGARVYPDTARIDVSAFSDEAGVFDLSDLPPGPYVIAVEKEGFLPQTKLIEVLPGQNTTLDFDLKAQEVPTPEPLAIGGNDDTE